MKDYKTVVSELALARYRGTITLRALQDKFAIVGNIYNKLTHEVEDDVSAAGSWIVTHEENHAQFELLQAERQEVYEAGSRYGWNKAIEVVAGLMETNAFPVTPQYIRSMKTP